MIRIALLLGVLLFSTPIDTNATHMGSVVIVGNSTTAPKELSIREIRSLFWGKTRKWENGTPVKVYVLPSSNPATLEFFSSYLGILPSTYWSNIFKQEERGDGIFVPRISPSESALYHSVDCTPGAIGYITKGEYEYHEHNDDMVDSMNVTH